MASSNVDLKYRVAFKIAGERIATATSDPHPHGSIKNINSYKLPINTTAFQFNIAFTFIILVIFVVVISCSTRDTTVLSGIFIQIFLAKADCWDHPSMDVGASILPVEERKPGQESPR